MSFSHRVEYTTLMQVPASELTSCNASDYGEMSMWMLARLETFYQNELRSHRDYYKKALSSGDDKLAKTWHGPIIRALERNVKTIQKIRKSCLEANKVIAVYQKHRHYSDPEAPVFPDVKTPKEVGKK